MHQFRPVDRITTYMTTDVVSRNKMIRSIVGAAVLFVVSLFVNFYAGTYASAQAGNSVNDLILDHIRVFDVDGAYVYGITLFFVIVAGLLVRTPQNAPFILKTLSLFVLIRSVFICLTHIGPAAHVVALPPTNIATLFTFSGDLFFSAHTGLPFLLALLYWANTRLRLVFLGFAACLGAVVLLGHYHYSIDVFSAFFITYGIFDIAKIIFKEDFRLFAAV